MGKKEGKREGEGKEKRQEQKNEVLLTEPSIVVCIQLLD